MASSRQPNFGRSNFKLLPSLRRVQSGVPKTAGGTCAVEPGGQTGTSRAALCRTRGGRSAPRGALLFATGTTLPQRQRGVTIGRRSRVKLQRRLTTSVPQFFVMLSLKRATREGCVLL